MNAPPTDDTDDTGDAIDEGFRTMLKAQIDDFIDGSATLDDLIQKIKTLGKSHGAMKDGAGDTTADDDTTNESKRSKPDPWVLLQECRDECGPEFTPGPALLKALAGLSRAADRKALLAEHRAQGRARPERPQSGRGRGNEAARTEESRVPQGAKDFARFIRE